MAHISLKNISFGGPQTGGAIRELSLEFHDRELTVLFSPEAGAGANAQNGVSAPKRLLWLIAGLEPAGKRDRFSGEIWVGNRPVQTLAPHERQVSFVFRGHGLFPHWSVAENIALGLRGSHATREETQKRLAQVVGLLGLEALLEPVSGASATRSAADLTPAESFRVALARAIISQPKVILLDDPLAPLSAQNGPSGVLGAGERAALLTELAQLQERLQTPMIYATGSFADAMRQAHRVCVFNGGTLAQTGAPLEIYARPADLFVARVWGEPPMNLLRGQLRATPEGLQFKESGGTVEVTWPEPPTPTTASATADAAATATPSALFSGPAESPIPAAWREAAGREVVLGLRPEAIRATAPEPATRAGVKARGTRCQGIVDHIVATGADVFYAVQTGAHTLLLRGNPDAEPIGAGRRIPFEIDSAKAHLFDAATGRRTE